MTRLSRRGALGLLASPLAAPALAQSGQPYPSRPIVVVIPFATGGSFDAVFRVIKPHLERRFGQPVVVDYRPGGATTIGTHFVARARPDGYTLGIIGDSFAVNPTLYRNLPFDTLNDLLPLTMLGTGPLVVTVGAHSRHDSLGKLLAAARVRPEALSYASVGAGSTNHLVAEMLCRSAGVQMVHVPYRGGGPAVTDVISGHVDMMIMSLPLARPHLDNGTVRAIATTSQRRIAALPAVPTVVEEGLPSFDAFTWQGVVMPAGTPTEIARRQLGDWQAALQVPEVKDGLGRLGLEVAGNSSEEFQGFIRAAIEQWDRVIREANIQPD